MRKEYFRANKYHKEIFGFDESCSYHELLFAAEAPKELSGIDIWKYVEQIPLELCTHFSNIANGHPYYVFTKEEIQTYPFYELFLAMYLGNFISPFIFEKTKDGLVCIEGKHRLRIAMVFNIVGIPLKSLPSIVVERCGTGAEPRYPANYDRWIDWIQVNSYRKRFGDIREAFERAKWD